MLHKPIHILFYSILLVGVCLLASCKSKTRKYSPKENKTYKENMLKANRGLVTKDQDEIASYVSGHNWSMSKTETGLWFEIMKEGAGKKAASGRVAHIRYQVHLLDGTLCYSSDSLGVKAFKIGHGGVEAGLEEAILMLKEGDAGRFILPPHLAYGLLGDENKIPPRSTIVYNVELLNLTDN